MRYMTLSSTRTHFFHRIIKWIKIQPRLKNKWPRKDENSAPTDSHQLCNPGWNSSGFPSVPALTVCHQSISISESLFFLLTYSLLSSLWIPDKRHLTGPVYPHHFCWGTAFLPGYLLGFPLTAFGSSINLALFSYAKLREGVTGNRSWSLLNKACLEVLLGEILGEDIFWEESFRCYSPCSQAWINRFRRISWTKLSIGLPDPSWDRLVRWLVVFRNPLCGQQIQESELSHTYLKLATLAL